MWLLRALRHIERIYRPGYRLGADPELDFGRGHSPELDFGGGMLLFSYEKFLKHHCFL